MDTCADDLAALVETLDLTSAIHVGHSTGGGEVARYLYRTSRAAFPDFHAEIHWQISDGDRVTTYKTYHGTHEGTFWGLAPTGRKVHFEAVDVMRLRNCRSPTTGGRESPVTCAATWPSARLGSVKERPKQRMTNVNCAKLKASTILMRRLVISSLRTSFVVGTSMT